MENYDRLKALEALSDLDQKLGLDKFEWPADREINGLKLVCTCGACPEQYNVFNVDGTQVGYLRLRHGWFYAAVPDVRGKTVHESYPRGDGIFDEDERLAHLTAAIDAIKNHYEKGIEDASLD